jgi:Beta/Gamma crystallin
MSRITPGVIASGLLAVSLSLLAATSMGTSGASPPVVPQDPAIDTPANAPTDFSSQSGGGYRGRTRVAGSTSIHNTRVTTFTGRRLWWRGSWHSLIGMGLLSGFAIGRDIYYPAGYVALAQPACSGGTDDGCALRWQSVSTNDGAAIPQCVQFCPRNGAAAAPVPAGPPVASPREGCEVEVFHEPNLSGASAKTTEDQPVLNEWDKQISSIHVISGTWEFSSEQQYGGDAVRLLPGTYQNLAEWDKQTSSFMCVQYRPVTPMAAGPPAAESRQGCEVEVFQEQNLSGASAKTTEDQPVLNEWDKQISSIHVIAGTWNFASEQQYRGETVRLAPGTYGDLANWDKQISSFMCVQ